MDLLIKERASAEDEGLAAKPAEILPSGLLAEVQELYDRGRCRQAYELGHAAVPLKKWRSAEAGNLAGRILLNMGATRLAFRHHIHAFRTEPAQLKTRAYYLETVLRLRGPIFAWQLFRRFETEAGPGSDSRPTNEGWEYLFSLGARIHGHFRDFEGAEKYFKTAAAGAAKTPWLLVEEAGLLAMRERWEDAVGMARQALAVRPDYRPAIQQLAHYLHTTNRDAEALALLTDAATRIESLPLLAQLAGLQMDLEKYAEAIATLDGAELFSPVFDQAHRNWLAVQRCRAHCALGNHALAETAARLLEDEYHVALAERLHGLERPLPRVRLNVPFIQQFQMTCVPATLAMLRHFWQMEADQVVLAEAVCYDGTPSHRARRWAEANGMLAREFTLDWEIAVALLERQIPFAVFTTETTSAHVQVIAGYDALRRTFIIRNPAFPQIQEVAADQFLKRYAATGPACMVLVPAADAGRLAGLEFADTERYDGLRRVQEDLEHHRREEAGAGLAGMQAAAPDHWLTLTAGRAVYSYDTNLPALRDCFDRLLARFPEDGNLLYARLACGRDTGRREDRIESLRRICRHAHVDPVFRQQYAEELISEGRNAEAERELKKALRSEHLNLFAQTTLADLYWSRRQFAEALDLYWFGACADDKKEPAAHAYFAAANARGKTAQALEFLQERSRRNIGKSAAPFITWFRALRQVGRAAEATQRLDEALRAHPGLGDLWLTAADAHARQSDFERAAECLARAEGKVRPQALLNARADLARFRGDLKSALSLWSEALQTEPLAVHIHRSVAWVMAESEGSAATLKHLRALCERFPHHYQLHQLWCEWTRPAGPEAREEAIRVLLKIHPEDAWARRELALALAEGGRFEEALVEAEAGLRLEPQQAASHTTRALIRVDVGQIAEARTDYQEAIRLSVDCSAAIHGLVNSGGTVTERREFLALVEQELARQVVHGEGLDAYCDAARLNLEPEALLASLRVALAHRPDLAVAWSVVVNQLAGMLQVEEALTLARQAAEQFPLNEQAWLDLALVQRLRLDLPGEREALEQAMRVSPANSVAPRMLAHHFERLGELAWAREKLEIACARAPLDAVSHGSLALILWRQGMRREAMDRIRHAVKIQPGYMWGWQTLGHWAAADGQPKLAEELAKIMVLQRPGDTRSLMVLARILVDGKRLPEALQEVNRAIKLVPRNVEAHELRAQILAALQRNAEADAACAPEIWGQHPPATLRARRARLEAARGNLVSAIERLKEVLQENPGYSDGWQNLADWLWHQKQFDEALAAATNLRRLDPLNPLPLGYRASLKLQRNERADARKDLEMALKLDPAYEFAFNNLFDLQLEGGDITAARNTLEYIRRYAGAEKAKACEIKLRAKFLQAAAGKRPPGSPPPLPGQAAELDQAVAQFKDLCLSKDADGDDFDMAIKALLDAGHKKPVDQALEAAILISTCHPAVGKWWMQRRLDRRKWLVPSAIVRLCESSEAARNAVIRLIEAIAEKNRIPARPFSQIHLPDIPRQLFHGSRLGWLAWRHRKWLRADIHGWGAMGYALVTMNRFVLTKWWLRDWRSRADVQMWMLYNLVTALRKRKRWSQAEEVLEFAVKRPEQDHTFTRLRLMWALELAQAGRTGDGAAQFRECSREGCGNTFELYYDFTKGLLAVQQAAPDQKKQAFKTELAAIRNAMARYKISPAYSEYRRCVAKMARDAGQWWRLPLLWLGF